MENIDFFKEENLLTGVKTFFQKLNVNLDYLGDQPFKPSVLFAKAGFNAEKSAHALMDKVYAVGKISDESLKRKESDTTDLNTLEKADYDFILVMAMELKTHKLPSRGELAELTRLSNKIFNDSMRGIPVMVVFRYGNQIALGNAERADYKQEGREGEKLGKVALLRDISIKAIHTGHLQILSNLVVSNNNINTFASLYNHWQEVFSVSLLNKKFYQELSNWYFWAIKHVTFPGEPTSELAHEKNAKLEDLIQEHRATNVIRMLTRLLFVWFIKEKKLIPEEIFELEDLQKDILKEITPYNEVGSMFAERNNESVYYKAILQNLFFATLNCPIMADQFDNRTREFRIDGTNRGVDYLMRYKEYFKNPEAFLEKLNKTVPFLNGGLFECLDNKESNLFIDGFSDNLPKGERLIVPDYLFFGMTEETDLSQIVGINNNTYKKALVKGLINILKSYKFTITENTPIEEEVALDPELLGKVFENLLASYNPDTKTNARKQTGSFYTPREIVNYMVDESLIAYLKNAISDWGGLDDETIDKELHVLTSFDSKVPFGDNLDLQKTIITALSTCTILDPACGSGAFPMGVLQKMVHVLRKIDPNNKVWKEVQELKVKSQANEAFETSDKLARDQKLLELSQAFDNTLNDPDYARKLFLIENCIYGVDIQPIAVQISKLRFFISLVVEQKPSKSPDNNFNIRPLPNLETKFVAANTLVGIYKGGSLFETDEVKKLEDELKIVRHKIFSLKSKERKIAWREKDKILREKLSDVLKSQGLPLETAENLSKWDPYNQNTSSPFFDTEWMFGIKNGFNVVIGNPPYGALSKPEDKKYFKDHYITTKTIKNYQKGSLDTYTIFIEAGYNFCSKNGNLIYIVPISITSSDSLTGVHNLLEKNCSLIKVSSYSVRPEPVFENAMVNTSIVHFVKDLKPVQKILATKMYRRKGAINLKFLVENLRFIDILNLKLNGRYPKISEKIETEILQKILLQDSDIGRIKMSNGSPIFYRSAGGRYFKVITNYSTGSSAEKAIYLQPKLSNAIGAILSSNLFFWYYQIISDNLNLKTYEIETFGIPLKEMSDSIINELEKIYDEYLSNIESNANVRLTEKYANIESFKEYKIGKSKHIIDKIDDLIGPLYSLTHDEIEFIKNYEINFRLNEHDD
jgi:adenine-specific DNA-methyltransferase